MKSIYFNKKSFVISLLSLVFLPLILTKSQDWKSFDQVDTLQLCSSSESSLFIIGINSNEIDSEEGELLITKVKLFNAANKSLLQTFSDTSNSGMMAGEVEYVDINLDGCLDIDIHTGGYNLTPTHSFWLFNKTEKHFYPAGNFDQLLEYYVDNTKKEITSHEISTGGSGYDEQIFKIVDDSLQLIGTSSLNFNNYEKQEVINGTLKTVALDFSNEITDKNGSSITSVESYRLIFDSLFITQKKWLTYFHENIKGMWDSDIYDCQPWGCMKYLRKELYTYKKINGQIIQELKRYQVINDKWELVKEFIK